ARTVVAFSAALHAHPAVLHAYAAGRITTAQARLIVEFLDHPPSGMPADRTDQCRDALLGAAEEGDIRSLRATREVLRQMFDPDDTPPSEDRERNEFHASKTLGGRFALKADLDAET